MSDTDPKSLLAAGDAASTAPQTESPQKARSALSSILNYKVGIIPVPVYILLLALLTFFSVTNKINGEISMMIAALAVGGFTCAEIGKHVPVLRDVGGAALVTIFLPSFLVSAHFFPASFVQNVTTFTNSSNFIYLYISAVVAGSILSMDRTAMIHGFVKIFVPLLAGSLLALVFGALTGWLTGVGIQRSVFFVVIPVMAGGVGEGAIPLSVGYADILHMDQGQLLAQILPLTFFGNLVAIVISGMLHNFGKRHPALTGNGRLERIGEGTKTSAAQPSQLRSDFTTVDVTTIAAGGLTAIAIYLVGVLLYVLIRLPAPVGMLLLAILLKLINIIPPSLEEGVRVAFRFFVVAVTYPLLFAVAVALTPWANLVAAFHPANLAVVAVVVVVLTASGYFVGGRLGMYPIDTAIVNATHSGLGGTGDVMILSAAERMELMPFAQVATRIGGAITVTLALIALSRLG